MQKKIKDKKRNRVTKIVIIMYRMNNKATLKIRMIIKKRINTLCEEIDSQKLAKKLIFE